MAPRRRGRRPWHRTRAFRLLRTGVLAAALVTAGVRCEGHHTPDAPHRAAAAPATAVPGGAGGNGSGDDGPGGQDAGAGARGRGGDRSPSAGRTAPAPPSPAPLSRSRATSLRIPSLGIDAPVVGVGLDAGRQLKTPPVDEPRLVGWYEGGPAPGESGTAVAVGHRDTKTGAAVFAALGQVEPGRGIEVRRADGRTVVYTVDKVRVFDKDHFPDEEVYGHTDRPELHVITCGGLYTRRTGYSSNVVVFAHLTAVR
ncbi:class F sortase [Streptomyces sp. NPDC015220]|uniref:class F sortase n=1 Tax=Streptomyces sp. NPDC015220 TaxID=3364947 RepID=UPI0036FCCF44